MITAFFYNFYGYAKMQYMDTENNFLALMKKHSNFEESKIVILSAPLEKSVSWGEGTQLGPEAIIKASQYVEFYDDEFDNELCFEKGICTMIENKINSLKTEAALAKIEKHVSELIFNDKFVVTLGGEHTISQATIKAHHKVYRKMSVLQFDAHSDLRDSYQGSKYSHASVMARVGEFFNWKKITQVGIRAQCMEEAELIKKEGINTFFASAIRRGLHGNDWQQKVVDSLADEIYITFDVDYFDPSIMPSTGTPEPDGFLYHETLEIFRKIKKSGKKIIGFDVVEFAPNPNFHHPDILTARLIYKILNFALT